MSLLVRGNSILRNTVSGLHHERPLRAVALMASGSRSAGGVFEVVRKLSISLQRAANVELRVVALHDQYFEADRKLWHPIDPIAVRPIGPNGFGYAPEVKTALRTCSGDILHVHGLWMYPSVAALDWHRTTNSPYIVTPHGMLDPWALRNSRLKKIVARALFERRHLQKAACIHALCEPELRAVRSFGLRNPVCVIPNGIDIPDKIPACDPPWGSGAHPGRKILLYLGRIHPKKNLRSLIGAWAAVKRDCKASAEWCLAIVGWNQNNHETELQQHCRDVGVDFAIERNGGDRQTTVNSSIVFAGAAFGDAKAAAYYNADAFILPSLSEGLPMVVLEAWAYAKPVIMTPECNLPVGFSSGAALKCETSPEAIAEQLRCLVSMDDADRREMGVRGLGLVSERFAWPIVARQMRDVYTWCIGGGSRPDVVYG